MFVENAEAPRVSASLKPFLIVRLATWSRRRSDS